MNEHRMNHEESERIARNILDKEYQDYEITVNSHADGTNVRTIVATIDNLTITLTIDNDTGELLNKTESRHYSREIVEKMILITDIVTRTVKGIRFKTNSYALLAIFAIVGFQIFFILTKDDVIALIIQLTLGFLIFLAGFFSINRNENLLKITMRKILGLNKRKIQQNQGNVSRTCETCGHRYTENPPCPQCGNFGSSIVGVVNETVEIPESVTAVRRSHFTKINYFGLVLLAVVLILQSYLAINFGGIAELIIGHLFGFLTFIPSYYAFLKIHFTDTDAVE